MGGVGEAGKYEQWHRRVLHTGPPAGPMLTSIFASITAPLSTSGSTRSRSPLCPTPCRGVHPCDITTWDEKKKRRNRKETQRHKRLVIVSAQHHHRANGQPPHHHTTPSQPFTPSKTTHYNANSMVSHIKNRISHQQKHIQTF